MTEPEKISVKFHKMTKCSEFYLCIQNSCKNLTFIFSGSLEKCKTKGDIVQIILVQGFCPLKIEITQFPDGFRLKSDKICFASSSLV